MPLISIITVNYNGLDMTVDLLKSIDNQSYKNIEIFVVDNASKEDPAAFFRKNYPQVKFIRSEKNLGFAGGNNLAVKEAKGDFLFFINNDAEITVDEGNPANGGEGCLQKLVALFTEKPKLGIVSPLLLYFNESKGHDKDLIQYAGTTRVDSVTARNKTLGEKEWDNGQFNTATETAYAHGAAMMIKREVVDNVGVMFEDFFLYYEELDWCERIRKAGYEIYVEPRARVYHKESASVGQMSTLKTFYINRNRIYFMRRNFGGINLLLFSLFLIFITIPKNVLMFLLRGQVDHAKVFLKAVWWNVTH
jgi:GT2 family glycosyltransferase